MAGAALVGGEETNPASATLLWHLSLAGATVTSRGGANGGAMERHGCAGVEGGVDCIG